MCPVVSHWENGQGGCEGVDDGPSTSSTIERDWRQSLPKKLEKAEVPPDSGQGNSFCNPLTKKRGYSKLVNEYYEKQNEILSQFSDLDTFEERMALNADAMVSRLMLEALDMLALPGTICSYIRHSRVKSFGNWVVAGGLEYS
jgi:hypothetical protein